jgi:hypothetical protein
MASGRGEESHLYSKKWVVSYALNGLSVCKDLHCLCGDKKIAKGSLRIGRRYPSPFDPDSIAINWFHAKCMFHQQRRSRVGTQIIGSLDDIDGIDNILLADKDLIEELIHDNIELIPEVAKENVADEQDTALTNSKTTVAKSAASIKKATKKSNVDPNGRRISINKRDAGRVLMM